MKKTDFGYSLQKDRQIDFDANDRTIVKRIAELEPSFRICIACGTCAATCSSGHFTDLSLRRIITSLKRGVYTGIAEEIKKCMHCGKCQMACPRGVSTRSLLLAIRKSMNENLPKGGKHEDL
jgi:heterodisulfide reductase subunit C